MRKKTSTIFLHKKTRKPPKPQKRGGKSQHASRSAAAMLDLIDSGWLVGWSPDKVAKLKAKGGVS